MKIIRHGLSQPFLLAVSLAALAHSSWSFSTLFTGLEPQPQFSGAWFAWLAPGVLLAFSVDIGLLSLANQIRGGSRGKSKLAAFGVLCLAMMFLQFLYISHHAPEVTLGAGVRADWIPLVALIRDASIWILPALLPVALALFAFSEAGYTPNQNITVPSTAIVAAPSRQVELISIDELPAPQKIEIECDVTGCGWAGVYDSQRAAINALSGHQRKHSIGQPSSNGRH